MDVERLGRLLGVPAEFVQWQIVTAYRERPLPDPPMFDSAVWARSMAVGASIVRLRAAAHRRLGGGRISDGVFVHEGRDACDACGLTRAEHAPGARPLPEGTK